MADETIELACPRCGSQVSERFWGPCAQCRAELVELMRREAKEIETTRFEPAMHVVPNQIATKD